MLSTDSAGVSTCLLSNDLIKYETIVGRSCQKTQNQSHSRDVTSCISDVTRRHNWRIEPP